MSEKERENFLQHAASRAPGKRQFKPSLALVEGIFPAPETEDGEEDDLDFTAGNAEESGSAESSGSESDESVGGYESDSESEDLDKEVDEHRTNLIEDKELNHPTATAVISTVGKPVNELIARTTDEIGPTTSTGQSQHIEHITGQICSVCLDLKRSDTHGELVQCDKCGIVVHEVCYGIVNGQPVDANHADSQSLSSSASTEPWFCEPCLLGNGIIPHCELCPNRFGAFKQADIPGCWVHLLCALYTPGISFLDVDRLSGVSWQEVDYRNFGRKSCSGCADKLESRTGITICCDAGFCKNFFHVTCAQKLGLLVENAQNDHSMCMERGYIYCKKHNHFEAEISRQKKASAKFWEQEEHRMVAYRHIQLDERQEKKWKMQLEGRLKHMKQLPASGPILSQKRAKFLHSNGKFLNTFAEKAELLGITRKQFEDEFYNVPTDQLPIGLPPAFSKAFIGYVENRDTVCIGEEEAGLEISSKSKLRLLESQKNLESELKKVKSRNNELTKKCTTQSGIFEKFKSFVRTFTHNSIGMAEEQIKDRAGQKRSKTLSISPTCSSRADENPAKRKRTNATDEKDSFEELAESTKSPKSSPTKSSKSPAHQSFTEKISSATYLLGHQNIPTSLFSKFGFNDKAQKLLPLKESPSKIPPNILKKAGPRPKDSTDSSIYQQPTVHPNECHKCKKATDQHLLIFCESCKFFYHIQCLDPPLDRMPQRNKFSRFECSDCACPTEEDKQDNGTGEMNVPSSDWALTSKNRVRRQLRAKS